ncbi:MAG: hypothetical protein EHM14_03575 [Methanothrix sp.]|nr:MAG: hypothetical protein EHM14_03575 [Methanothrix sp.]
MMKRLIILSLLALMLVGSSMGQLAQIPASKDVYIGLGTENQRVYNQSNLLICAVNVTDINGSKVSIYPGAPLIQFDISNINVTDDDIAILVLKAASIKKSGGDSALVALLSIGSEWDEESDYTTLLVNILPAWNVVKKNDLTQMGSDSDGDQIFAFDVSKKLRDAKATGNSMSFLLEAISNSSYEADFLSRESGQGPYLIVMPYPESKLDSAQATEETGQAVNQTAALPRAVVSALAAMPATTSAKSPDSMPASTTISSLTSNVIEEGSGAQEAAAVGSQTNELTNKTVEQSIKLDSNQLNSKQETNKKLTAPFKLGNA